MISPLSSDLASGESLPIRSREELVRASGNHPSVVGNEFHYASCGGVFGGLVPKSCRRCRRQIEFLADSFSFYVVVALCGLAYVCTLFGDGPVMSLVMLG